MKMLVVSGILPSRKNWSGFFMLQLFRGLGQESCAGFFLTSKKVTTNLLLDIGYPLNFDQMTVMTEKGYRARRLPVKLRFLASFLVELKRKYIEIPRLARVVLLYAQEQKVSRILVTLDGQTSVWLAQQLMRRSDMPINLLKYESAETIGLLRGLDRFSKKMLGKSYDFCLKNAQAVYSAENMKEKSTLSGDSQKNSSKSLKADKLIIGVGGDIFQVETFKAFAAALDTVYWEIDGRKVEIWYWGSVELPIKGTRIRKLTLEDCQKMSDLMVECDILYFPYWFDASYLMGGELSGRTVLAAYLASKAIIFYHGSDLSKIAGLLKERNAAVVCGSLDAEVIKMNLRKAIHMPSKGEMVEQAHSLIADGNGWPQLFETDRIF